VAARLVGAVREGDTVARLGGDEFAVLIEAGTDPLESAARIAAVLAAPFLVQGREWAVRASVGVCAAPADEPTADAEQVLALADAAMYSAKRAGKGRVVGHVDERRRSRYVPELLAAPSST
jgi:diguanylate cyclase